MEPKPLSVIKAGTEVRLISIMAGEALNARLAAMGLLPGTILRVLRNGRRGPVIISVKECRLMLGRGMVENIYVV